MDSSHELKIALIKIRLMADISRDAQCKVDEINIVMEMISELADRALDDEEQENLAINEVTCVE
ncbi:hypothetical protein AB6880_19880 [Rahnella inusitata]|uniref:hypothetical protein n=1 Tax=Rahnella inusitata TaxID=58169 RepID=UPI0039BE1EB4